MLRIKPVPVIAYTCRWMSDIPRLDRTRGGGYLDESVAHGGHGVCGVAEHEAPDRLDRCLAHCEHLPKGQAVAT